MDLDVREFCNGYDTKSKIETWWILQRLKEDINVSRMSPPWYFTISREGLRPRFGDFVWSCELFLLTGFQALLLNAAAFLRSAADPSLR